VRVTFCGVRGSVPAPGPEFVRVGGNTSCVAVAADGADPSLVLDAGTGVRRLSRLLAGRPFRGTVLLSHLHPDHTQGLPFFAAADAGAVDLRLPAQGDPIEVLARAYSPPHFPLSPGELRGAWTFTSLEVGEHRIGEWVVLALELPHGGGRTFGYRVSDGRASLAYVTDHCPTLLGAGPDGYGEYHDAAVALATGADLLIHDAHLTPAELPERAFLGHATAQYAVGLAERAGARRLALFHHDPDRTDDDIEAIVGGLISPIPVFAAAEGQTIDLPS
jgi:phosphoribosyl 1,2-cyclic phosphodiesterase